MLTERPQVDIIRDDRQDFNDDNFSYELVSENGIVRVVGTPGSGGQSNVQGSCRFPLPDGTIATVNYIADEFGYQQESDLLPITHPLPAHAFEQRRRGIKFDQRGFRVNRK